MKARFLSKHSKGSLTPSTSDSQRNFQSKVDTTRISMTFKNKYDFQHNMKEQYSEGLIFFSKKKKRKKRFECHISITHNSITEYSSAIM